VRVWPIFKKEMGLYFTSPVAYVVITMFLLVVGYFFYSIFVFFSMASMQAAMNPMMARELNVTDGVMRPLFSNISVIMLLLMPMLTMRLFSEERKSGTIELLLTYPVRDGAVLITGVGHARRDRGVPAHLARHIPDAKIASLAFLEVDPAATKPADYAARFGGEPLPFDYVWFTPKIDDADPCEKFKQARAIQQ